MHESAMLNAKRFFDTYGSVKDSGVVIDIGSQNVNGSLKEATPDRFEYIGVDFQDANNVDIVLTDPYKIPIDDQCVDIVMSSSCLEHSEMFWLLFLEMVRITKPDGLIYLNIPSEGQYHSYPVDCWRFRIDSSVALMKWANRNGSDMILLEAYTDPTPPWHDMVAVYVADKKYSHLYEKRIDL